jgi:hypothetical protein
VATWTASQQAPSSFAFTTFGEPTSPALSGFDNQTVRAVVFTSVGGHVLCVHLSNRFGTQPVMMGPATVAVELSGAQWSRALSGMTFAGRRSVTIPAGGDAVSDPVRLAIRPLEDLAIGL